MTIDALHKLFNKAAAERLQLFLLHRFFNCVVPVVLRTGRLTPSCVPDLVELTLRHPDVRPL